jgi:peroxiredoxin Q/BCP
MALTVGDKVPSFSLKDGNGNVFESESVLGKKPVVIYFYPKDDTAGCTAQACSFRDSYQDFQDLGAEVIGISSDSETSHQKFAKSYKLPFILLADTSKKVRTLFGVPTSMFGLLPGRVTYVVDEKGIIRLLFDSMMPQNHMKKALDFIKKIQK